MFLVDGRLIERLNQKGVDEEISEKTVFVEGSVLGGDDGGDDSGGSDISRRESVM